MTKFADTTAQPSNPSLRNAIVQIFGSPPGGDWGYHVWILECPDWRPRHWSDLPRDAVFSPVAYDFGTKCEDALAFTASFNASQLKRHARRWAVTLHRRVCDQCPLTGGRQFTPIHASRVVQPRPSIWRRLWGYFSRMRNSSMSAASWAVTSRRTSSGIKDCCRAES